MAKGELGSSPLIVFLGVVFGGSTLLSLVIGLSGGYKSSFIGSAPVTMFLPALGVLAARVALDAHLDVEWDRLPLRWLPAALLILPLAIHAVALPGVVVLEGRLPWVQWLTPGPDGLYYTPQELGWGRLTLPALIGRIVINAAMGLMIVSFLAFFEEIGWRGFMLPRLVDLFGARRGAAVSAVIFALWHVPFAISGVQHVENVSPQALALVSVVGQFGAGLFLAFLWFKTGSILLVSLAHGAFNNWGQYAFKFMSTSGEHDLTLFALVNVALLAVGVVALTQTGSEVPLRDKSIQQIEN
jgi:membrane protease YdiL (CAAX protease family)